MPQYHPTLNQALIRTINKLDSSAEIQEALKKLLSANPDQDQLPSPFRNQLIADKFWFQQVVHQLNRDEQKALSSLTNAHFTDSDDCFSRYGSTGYIRQDVGGTIQDDGWDDNDDKYNFPSIYKAALNKQVDLGLKTTTSLNLLKAIILAGSQTPQQQPLQPVDKANAIRAVLQNTEGQNAFGRWNTSGPEGWDPKTETYIDNGIALEIQKKAQERYLLQIIQQCSDYRVIDVLLQASQTNDEKEFREILSTYLQVPKSVADAISLSDAFSPDCQAGIASKGLELYLNKEMSDAKVLEVDDTALQKFNGITDKSDDLPITKLDLLKIIPHLPGPILKILGLNLKNNDICKKIYEDFLLRHLKATLATSTKTDVLVLIARSTIVEKMRDLICDDNVSKNKIYSNIKITEKNLPEIRQLAVAQAIKLNIAQCDDPQVLDAIIKKTTSPKELQRALQDSKTIKALNSVGPEVGDIEEEEEKKKKISTAYKAITDQAVVDTIKIAASVQKTLLDATSDQLKILATAADEDEFVDKYLELFKRDAIPAEKDKFKNYFKSISSSHIKLARQNVLIRYIHEKVSGPDKITNLGYFGFELENELENELDDDLSKQLRNSIEKLDNSVYFEDLIDNRVTKKLKTYIFFEENLQSLEDKLTEKTAEKKDIIDNLTHILQKDNSLSKTEKETLLLRYLETIVRHHSNGNLDDDLEFLQSLIDEKSPKKVKNILKTNIDDTFNVGDLLDAFDTNPEAIKTIQEAAKARITQLANEKNYLKILHFDKHRHALKDLISKLSPEIQKALSENPDVLQTLVDARSEADVAKTLGDYKFSKDLKPLVTELIKENQRLATIATIANSTIAETFAGISPPLFDLDDKTLKDLKEGINNFNRSLLETKKSISLIKYISFLKEFGDINFKDQQRKTAFFRAFGLDYNGAIDAQTKNPEGKVVVKVVYGDFKASHNNYNKNLSSCYQTRGLKDSDRDIILFLASLEKIEKLTDSNPESIPTLITFFKESDTKKDFFDKIDKHNEAKLNVRFNDNLVTQLKKRLTPETFRKLKGKINNSILLNEDGYKNLIEQDKKDLATQSLWSRIGREKTPYSSGDALKDITHMATELKDYIKTIGGLKNFNWIDPLGGEKTAEQAEKIQGQFKHIAEQCLLITEELDYQQKMLTEKIQNLPKDADITPSDNKRRVVIESHRNLLQAKLDQVEKMQEEFKPLKEKLFGDPTSTDPLMQQGIMLTLEEAIQCEEVRELRSLGTNKPDEYAEVPVGELASYLKDTNNFSSVDLGASSPHVTASVVSSTLDGLVHKTTPTGYAGILKKTYLVPLRNNAGTNAGTAEMVGALITREFPPTEYLPEKTTSVTVVEPKLNLLGGGKAADSTLQTLCQQKAAIEAAIIMIKKNGPPTKDRPFKLTGGTQDSLARSYAAFVYLSLHAKELGLPEFSYKEGIKIDNTMSTTFKPSDVIEERLFRAPKFVAPYAATFEHPSLEIKEFLIIEGIAKDLQDISKHEKTFKHVKKETSEVYDTLGGEPPNKGLLNKKPNSSITGEMAKRTGKIAQFKTELTELKKRSGDVLKKETKILEKPVLSSGKPEAPKFRS